MKNNHVSYSEGELTIYCGENARTNCHESLRQAGAICKQKRKEKILYLNTFFTTRKMKAAIRHILPAGAGASLQFMNVNIGNLANELGRIERKIEAEKIACVIINSWEFAHRSYIYKERALFDLMGIMNSLEVSLLIYSQARVAEAGKIQRGGLGKLSAIADAIIQLLPEEKEEKELEASPTDKSVRPTGENKMLDARKINELEYARGENGRSSGSELVWPVEEEVMEGELVEA